MPSPTSKLVYDFRRKLGLLTSAKEEDIPVVDTIAYLNEFQQIAFNNVVREAERNQSAANEIRRFKVDRQPLLLSTDGKIVLAKYPANFHTRLNQLAEVSNAECCGDITKEISIRVVQSDDLHPARKNPLQRSSFYFERLIAVISAEGLLLYPDDQLTVDKVIIDYYRKPSELHSPSLVACNGEVYYLSDGSVITEDTYCEFENDSFITDGAVLLATADRKDTESFNLRVNRFLQTQTMNLVQE